jgi:hypothetical protein
MTWLSRPFPPICPAPALIEPLTVYALPGQPNSDPDAARWLSTMPERTAVRKAERYGEPPHARAGTHVAPRTDPETTGVRPQSRQVQKEAPSVARLRVFRHHLPGQAPFC